MNKISDKVRRELEALAQRPESTIDFSDIPETTNEEWKGAERGRFYRRTAPGR